MLVTAALEPVAPVEPAAAGAGVLAIEGLLGWAGLTMGAPVGWKELLRTKNDGWRRWHEAFEQLLTDPDAPLPE